MLVESEMVAGWQNISGRVSPATALELIKFIRLAARTGKSTFIQFLREPLLQADYKVGHIQDSILKIMERIEQSVFDPASVHTVGYKIKRLISRALNDSLSALGDSCIFVLEKSLASARVSTDPDVIKFVNIIGPALYAFQKIQSEQSEKIFENVLLNTSAEEISKALEPVNLGNSIQKVQIDHRMRALFQQVLSASRNNDLNRCRKLLSAYMIRFSDEDSYDEDGVEKIIAALEKRDSGFRSTLNEMTAVQLYYQITNGVAKSDMKSAIVAIRKYAHIFTGDSTMRFFYEIDRMERILFRILKEKKK
ncbi:MAG: hypothetical protein KDK38_02145 [Leptospiraceae bacterium]|nr:hypothetical protein [Leptospiraceae bacterium]